MFKPQNLHVIYKHCTDWDKLIPFRDRTIQEVGFLMSESSNLNLSRMHSSSVLFQTFIIFLTNLKLVLIIYYSYFLIVGLRRESVIDLYNESFLCSLISALFFKKKTFTPFFQYWPGFGFVAVVSKMEDQVDGFIALFASICVWPYETSKHCFICDPQNSITFPVILLN